MKLSDIVFWYYIYLDKRHNPIEQIKQNKPTPIHPHTLIGSKYALTLKYPVGFFINSLLWLDMIGYENWITVDLVEVIVKSDTAESKDYL